MGEGSNRWKLGIGQEEFVECFGSGRMVYRIELKGLNPNPWVFFKTGLPDFSRDMIPKPGKMCQMNTNCTKWS
jgi:hypothetical protein